VRPSGPTPQIPERGRRRRRIVRALLSIGSAWIAAAGAAPTAAAQETGPPRGEVPVVGLALSGGGVRGFAHIGVIEVLEEAGISAEIVSGTSMGSIVGGLYAIGYMPEQLREIAARVDWPRVFDDAPERRNLPIERKQEEGRVAYAFPIDGLTPRLPSGVVEGQRISQLLTRLTWSAHSVHDFTRLPRSFVAVATDLETGDAVPLVAGYLPEAMRASMAIPGAFAPVEIGGRVLIDGGIARNLPAEDARTLGADRVICSDVSEPLARRDSLESFPQILSQTVAFRMVERTEVQREECDLLIVTRVEGVGIADFGRVNVAIEAGRASARATLDSLLATGASLRGWRTGPRERTAVPDPTPQTIRVEAIEVEGLRGTQSSAVRRILGIAPGERVTPGDLDRAVTRLYDSGRFRYVGYRLEPAGNGAPTGDGRALRLDLDDRSRQWVGFGYRYDGRYEASILATGTLRDLLFAGTTLSVDLRLGEQFRTRADYSKRWGWTVAPIVAVRGELTEMPFDLYVDGDRVASPDVQTGAMTGIVGLGFRHNTFLGLEGKLERADRGAAPAVEDWADGSGTLASVAAVLRVDRKDRATFPRKGWTGLLKSEWGEASGGGGAFRQHVLDIEAVVPVLPRFGILGRLTLGTSEGDSLPSHYLFFSGGSRQYQLYVDRQFPFYGRRVQEVRGRHLQAGTLGVQWEPLTDVFLQLRGNAAALPATWEWDEDAWRGGWGVTAGARTRFGTLALTVAGRDLGDGPRLEIDAGFPF